MNFVQFFAMLGCVIGVSLIAKQLGGGPSAQIFAALATMTMPMGILQATSTQNDYVVALWSVRFPVLVLVQAERGPSREMILLSGAALGLAMLTKTTAILYLACIGLWFAIEMARRLRLGARRPLIVVLLVAIIVVAPHSFRNYSLYGNPLGISSDPELAKLTNESYGVSALDSNILRNLGLRLVSPIESLNNVIRRAIKKAHTIMGISVNDPLTTWHSLEFKISFTTQEDRASKPVQLLLLAASTLLLVLRRQARMTTYVLCLVREALAFCFVLKWQPWRSRLHLPFFVLAFPIVGVVGSRYLRGWKIYIPALILAIVALPYLFANPSRPVLGSNSIFLKARLNQYFYDAQHPSDFASYDAAARIMSNFKCSRIGLVVPYDDHEYLVWVTARAYILEVRVEHILVSNVSGTISIDFTPCAIIVTSPIQGGEIYYEDHVYVKSIGTDEFNLFLISDPTQQSDGNFEGHGHVFPSINSIALHPRLTEQGG